MLIIFIWSAHEIIIFICLCLIHISQITDDCLCVCQVSHMNHGTFSSSLFSPCTQLSIMVKVHSLSWYRSSLRHIVCEFIFLLYHHRLYRRHAIIPCVFGFAMLLSFPVHNCCFDTIISVSIRTCLNMNH